MHEQLVPAFQCQNVIDWLQKCWNNERREFRSECNKTHQNDVHFVCLSLNLHGIVIKQDKSVCVGVSICTGKTGSTSPNMASNNLSAKGGTVSLQKPHPLGGGTFCWRRDRDWRGYTAGKRKGRYHGNCFSSGNNSSCCTWHYIFWIFFFFFGLSEATLKASAQSLFHFGVNDQRAKPCYNSTN